MTLSNAASAASSTAVIIEQLTRRLQFVESRLLELETLEDIGGLTLPELSTAPTTPVNGRLYRADGTSWNPGSGQGVYCYYNAAYNYLG